MLKVLKLENFRNHEHFELDLGKTTVILGQNGIGKTNILEAIALLSFCRSFRLDDKKNLIQKDKEYFRIVGDDLEIFLSKTPRSMMQVKERGAARKISDFIGLLPAVVFSYETIAVISGSPMDRRRFLDVMISQVDKEYFRALVEYKKIKTQRNNLLQKVSMGLAKEDEMVFWNERFVELGMFIVRTREGAIEYLNTNLGKNYELISGEIGSSLKLEYMKNSDDLNESLRRLGKKEMIIGKTLFGPHKDDIKFNLNSLDMSLFASRGEIRSAILSLKIEELNFIEKNNKMPDSTPILLLDDIFSELDPKRREHLGELVGNYQTLITSTEESLLSEYILNNAKVVKL